MKKISLFLCLFLASFLGKTFAQQEVDPNLPPVCQVFGNYTFEKLVAGPATEGFTCLKQDPADNSLWAVGYYYEEVINPIPTKCESSPYKILVAHFNPNAELLTTFVVPIPTHSFSYPSDFVIDGNNLVIIGYEQADLGQGLNHIDYADGKNSFILSVQKSGALNWMTYFPQDIVFVPQAIRVTPFRPGLFCPYTHGVYTIVGNIYRETNILGEYDHYAATVFVDPSQPVNMNIIGIPNVSESLVNSIFQGHTSYNFYSDFIFTEDRVYCDNWGDIYTVGKMTHPGSNNFLPQRVGVNVLNKLELSSSGTAQYANFPIFPNIGTVESITMYNECILKEDDDKLIISGYGDFNSNFLSSLENEAFMYAVNPNNQQNHWFNTYDIPGYNSGFGVYLGEVISAKNTPNYYVLGKESGVPMDSWPNGYRCFLMQTDLNGENPVAKEFNIKIYRKKNLIAMGDFVYFVGSKLNPLNGNEDAVLVKQSMNLSDIEDCVLKIDVTHIGYNIENEPLEVTNLEVEAPYLEHNPPICTPTLREDCICRSRDSVGNRLLNIEELQKEVIVLHPIPAKKNLLISNLSEMGIISKVQILNTNGQNVYEQAINQEKAEIELNVSQLPQGVYILKVDTENGQQVQKFVKE